LSDSRELRLFHRPLAYGHQNAARNSVHRFLRRAASAVRARPRDLLSVQTWRTGLAGLRRAVAPESPAANRVNVRDVLASALSVELHAFLESGATLQFDKAVTRLSVVLVLWNRAELTLRCLRALSESRDVPLEVIVIDNASTDETTSLLARLRDVTVVRNSSNIGFTIAANQGARLATSEFVLFLNSDAQPLPGSLRALLDTISTSQSVGAVGGKLVFPDGTLQEAGGIVWSDGSCESYGRGDSPQGAEYCFERDVDFCSGAFLLTRREVFERLGGFDEAYSPAYYEDVDYCVRLWKDQQRVTYQPRATAIHFEFASSLFRAHGIKLQVSRRELFVARHRDWLASQEGKSAAAISARSHPATQLHVLIIDDIVPDPKRGAGFPRAAQVLHALRRLHFGVTLYATAGSAERSSSSAFGWVEVILGNGSAGIREFLESRRGYYSLIIVSRPHNMRYFRAAVGSDFSWLRAPVIYDAEAVSAIRDIGRRRLRGESVSDTDENRLVRRELLLAKGCASVIAVSPGEQEYFARAGLPADCVLGHAITPVPTPRSFDDREGLLFVGAFDQSSPNEDAAWSLISEIAPAVDALVRALVPLTIAGSRIPERLRLSARPDVSFVGDSEDLTPLYDRARVFVAPVKYAAGIPLKVLEAAANGVPVVCSALLARQLSWEHGKDILVADTLPEFASAIARLYSDRSLWEQLRLSAVQRITRECDPEIFGSTLDAVVKRTLFPETSQHPQ
jgi:GT2 family glycosyltransferase